MSSRSSISMFAGVLALTAFLPQAARAQAATDDARPDCNALVEALPLVQRTAQTTVKAEGEGCTITGFRISSGSSGTIDTGLSIARAHVRGAGLVRAAATQRFPDWLRLELSGVRVDVKTGKPGVDYLNRRQQKSFDVKLAYRSDKANDAIRIEEASLGGEALGHLRLDATIYGLDLSALKPGERLDLPSLRVGYLGLKFDNKAMIASFALPLIIGIIGYEHDPEPAFDAYRKQAIETLDLLLGSFISTASKEALTRFIRDFPDPAGPLELTAKADPPFALVRLGMLGGAMEPDDIRERLQRMLGDAKLEAGYRPAP